MREYLFSEFVTIHCQKLATNSLSPAIGHFAIGNYSP